MTITKAELLSDIESVISTATTNLNSVLNTGSISTEADMNKAYEYIFTINAMTERKTWIEANL